MARELAQRGPVEQRVEPLPTSHWTLFEGVRWPGSPDRRIDEVLVGPNGVHVTLHCPGPLPSPVAGNAGSDLEDAAGSAAAAAEAVAGLLSDRYRRVVRPVVCLPDTSDVALSVGEVFAASPDILRHAWRHQPRVLSTSEAHAVAGRLRLGLAPFPTELPQSAGRTARWGWRRLWLGGAVTAAGVTAALAVDPAQLWVHP